MPKGEVRFVSSSPQKVAEVLAILQGSSVAVRPVNHGIDELQIGDVNLLVRDKVIRAFQRVLRPVIVEHTALYLDRLNGFPGGQTRHFWECLRAEKFCEIFGTGNHRDVTARSFVGYCDGRRIHVFQGDLRGQIAPVPSPHPNEAFHWDSVFVPAGEQTPLADMGPLKHSISMRRKALEAWCQHLRDNPLK